MASASPSHTHWQRIYTESDPSEVSWFQAVPERSLALIERARAGRDAAIIDVGGGASTLAGELIDAGYTDVTVVDVSPAALELAKARLGDAAARITWIEADIRNHDLDRRYDLWHDRALFHFMVEPRDQAGYVDALRRSLRPGGDLIVATFGPGGPTRCSGLPVARYGEAELQAAIDGDFELVSSSLEDHRTPSGSSQEFLFAHLRRAA